MQGSCERLCNYCEGSGKEQEQLSLQHLYLARNSEQTLQNNVKDCSFVLFSNTIKIIYPQSLLSEIPQRVVNLRNFVLALGTPSNIKLEILRKLLNRAERICNSFPDWIISSGLHCMFLVMYFSRRKKETKQDILFFCCSLCFFVK